MALATWSRGRASRLGGPTPGPDEPVRVLFIGGEGRSGSTLLDRALGQLPGFFSVGEIRELWEWGLGVNALCGCGAPFRACAFWASVGEEAFGGWDRVDDVAVARMAAETERSASVAAMFGRPTPSDPVTAGYHEVLRRLYRSIRTCSDSPVIVDSTKTPSAALVLRGAGLDVRAVHLIRDSRGVAYSWSRTVPRPDAGGVEMRRFGPVRASVRWMGRNLLMEQLARSGTPTERMRYEDLVADLPEGLARAATVAGLSVDPHAVPVGRDGGLELRPNHTVMGNPLRMQTGRLDLEADDEWSVRMGGGARRMVGLLTAPLARRYGYRSKPTSVSTPSSSGA